MYYGIENREHLENEVEDVCNNLGSKPKLSAQMLMETCGAETQLGTFPDRHPEKLGVGAFQFDQIALDDLQKETDQRHKDKVLALWDYDLDAVELKDLAFDVKLAAICCRLKYMRIPDAIPTNYMDRASYWKRFYNTEAGKGTVEHYLEAVERFKLV